MSKNDYELITELIKQIDEEIEVKKLSTKDIDFGFSE